MLVYGQESYKRLLLQTTNMRPPAVELAGNQSVIGHCFNCGISVNIAAAVFESVVCEAILVTCCAGWLAIVTSDPDHARLLRPQLQVHKKHR